MKLGRKGLGKAQKTFNHKVLKNTNIQKRFPSTKKLSAYLCRNGFEPVNLVNGVVVYTLFFLIDYLAFIMEGMLLSDGKENLYLIMLI